MDVSEAELTVCARYLEGSGYVRRQNAARRKKLGEGWHRDYKKGWEVRLLARNQTEAKRLSRCLKLLGYSHGSTFEKGTRLCIPIYGREQVARFLAMVERVAPEIGAGSG
jgi:hypothetical protein